MNKIDFSTYKFRCSGLGHLMSKPRSKKETLSESTKTYLRDIYIQEVYGRHKEILSKFLTKGNHAEEDSLTLVTDNLDKLLLKNKEHFENKFIKGTPDVIKPQLIDIKTSWDIWTFAKADGTNKDYFWQLQGYMWLTGKRKGTLIYNLVNTPEFLIVAEKNRLTWAKGISSDTPEMAEMEAQVEKNMTYDDIPAPLRMKSFVFEYDADSIAQLKNRIIESREYLSSLTL